MTKVSLCSIFISDNERVVGISSLFDANATSYFSCEYLRKKSTQLVGVLKNNLPIFGYPKLHFMFLIFDTETTGFPNGWDVDPHDLKAYDSARLVQLAWQLHDANGNLISNKNYIVKPDGFEIPYAVVKIHGITTERALKDGHDIKFVLDEFSKDLERATYNVGHNIDFDLGIVGSEYYRAGLETTLFDKKRIDTKEEGTEFCAIPGGRGGKFKWPTLTELHQKLFNKPFADAHDAAYDVDATARCFFGLITQKVYLPEEITDPAQVKYQAPKLKAANFVVEKEIEEKQVVQLSEDEHEEMVQLPFAHLHCHTQFSVLQSPSSVNDIISKAKSLGLTHVAMTDHGNMMGAFHFVREALKQDLTPILGIEMNVCKDHLNKDVKDNGFQIVILAKNKKGYHNLTKIASIAQTEGFYYVPRVSREVLLKYKEDLVILTGGPWGEVPSLILNAGEMIAEKAFLWWKENFGENFYAEINRHGLEEEKVINDALLKFCKKHDVKYIASNNTYYAEQSDAKTQDVLLCVRDGEQVSKPKKYIGKGGREYRFGFPNDQFYMKSKEEMVKLFADLPEAIENIQEIIDQTERYKLAMDVLLPAFDIPKEFVDPKDIEDGGKRGENAFLRHLTYEGAKKRWGEITDEIRERLDFELETIAKTGYPGYFLIVQDFTTKAREMDVSVGPGRGSAAGSAVAYCIGITNVDPIKYDLLFERFLNPERVSLPDIDIDFDDEGRQRVIDYVIEKYGSNQVAQIITYGSMAAKSSIRDAARVLDLPLSEADRIAKLVPGIKLKKLFAMDDETMQNKFSTSQEDLQKAKMLVDIAKQTDLSGDTLNQAIAMEGSMRNTGIHACGVIITPEDITNYVPVARAKDSGMSCTQFDNSVVEDAGLLKMDFLGLKTLTLIKDTIRLIKENYDIEIVPDDIPLDDTKTYELFQRGETVGIFQYESSGMQKYLKELKPTEFSDLIAMNALYRPGPIEYIPEFIRRKHGESEIVYDLDDMKEYLEETYGITVYQEQVMLLSQKLADFTKGEADVLRKAMGKKQKDVLAKMKPKFIEQASAKGHDAKVLEKIWKDWEAFASYAFNKSHSTCYALIAFHTAYLKAHYPSEYMAAVLSNNMNDIKSVTFFMEECRRGGIPVLGPDVNESASKFGVNKNKEIRCGMAAIKGVGGAAVNSIIEERKKNGEYTSIFNFIERIDLRTTNKKVIENLVYAGGFDSFGIDRANFFAPNEQGFPFIEQLIKYGNAIKTGQETNQQSLFGAEDDAASIAAPKIPEATPWRTLERLSKEKEVVGMYISGHPLDDYRLEIDNFCTPGGLEVLNRVSDFKHKELKFAGIVTEFAHKFTKNGKPYGIFILEDYVDSHRFFVFGDDYVKFKDYFVQDWFLYVKGKVQPKRYSQDPDDFEFRINSIELLSNVREKYIKKITVNVGLKDISENFVDQLHEKLLAHPGKCKFQVKITDLDMSINMPAKNLKVELTNELIEELETMKEIEFSVS